MLRADLSQQKAQSVERIKASAELAAQYEFAERALINAIEKELIPWRKLLQAFATGDQWSIGHSGRLAAMRAEARLPALEAWQASRAEEPRSGFPFRQEGLTAKGAAPLFQNTEARQERESAPPQREETAQRACSACPVHRGRLPKTRAA